MRSCCPPRRMQWNEATDAIARCNATSIACARKRRSVYALRWTCGVKPKPKGVNTPSKHYMMRVQDENNPVSLLQCRFFGIRFALLIANWDVYRLPMAVSSDPTEEPSRV